MIGGTTICRTLQAFDEVCKNNKRREYMKEFEEKNTLEESITDVQTVSEENAEPETDNGGEFGEVAAADSEPIKTIPKIPETLPITPIRQTARLNRKRKEPKFCQTAKKTPIRATLRKKARFSRAQRYSG